MRRAVGSIAGAALLAAIWLLVAVVPAGAATGACASPALTSSAPQAPGTTVTFTASAAGCTTPEFKFFLQQPSGTWVASTPYGVATWTLDTNGWLGGVYGVGVWARQQGSTAAYETYWLGTFTLAVITCDVTDISLSPASAAAGTPVAVTASATLCPSPQYRFWIRSPAGVWSIGRDWGTSTWTWDTTGLANGVYQVGVWAKQPTSPNTYDAYAIKSFRVGSSAACTIASVAVSPPDGGASPTAPYTNVGLTALSNCTSPLYRWWLLWPDSGVWQSTGYTSSSTGIWTTAAEATYQVGLWVKESTEPASVAYDTYYLETYTVSVGRCNSVTIAPGPPPTQAGQLNFTVTAGGCASPSYTYWLHGRSATWITPSFPKGVSNPPGQITIDTTGLPAGPYQIGVWVQGTGGTRQYDTYAYITFWVG